MMALGAATALKTRMLLAGTPLATPQGQVTSVVLVLGLAGALWTLPERPRRWLLFTLVAAISLLLVTDQIHHRAFRELVSVRELSLAGQLASVLASITPYLRWIDLLYFFDWPLWIWLARRNAGVIPSRAPNPQAPAADLPGSQPPARQTPPDNATAPHPQANETAPTDGRRTLQPNPAPTPVRQTTFAIVTLLGLGSFVGLAWDYLLMPRPGDLLVTNRALAIRETGPLGYHLFDAVDLIRSRPPRRQIQPSDLARVRHWFASRPQPGHEIVPFGAARAANLVFLQLESFEAFLIGLTVNGQEITPRLNRLRARAWHFTRFFPQTGDGTTSDAEFAALNSLYPAAGEIVSRRDAHNTFRALPSILRDHGFHTMAMSVCRPDLWNMGWMHHQYGFSQRYYYDTFTRGREHPLKITDDRFLEQARQIMRDAPQPFFAHLMTISTHAPFTYLPAHWPRPNLGDWRRGALGDYLQAAHFVDHAVGRFLDALHLDGLLERTVVFIYGDHEALPADERWKARPLESDPIGSRLDEQLRRRVPLFILIPGQTRGVTVNRLAGQVDLTPTALHLLGISESPSLLLGHNLVRGTNSSVAFRTGAFAKDSHFFNSPDGLLTSGGCRPIQPDGTVDATACVDDWRQVQESLHISDLIREQDMIPALRQQNRP